MTTASEFLLLTRHIELGDIGGFLSQINAHWYYNGVSLAESDSFFWDEIRRNLPDNGLPDQFMVDLQYLLLRYLESHHIRSAISNIELKEALMSLSIKPIVIDVADFDSYTPIQSR